MKLTDLLKNLNESNEGSEHVRLRKALEGRARSIGYKTESVRFPSDCIPDVLLEDSGGNLFMGDAKDSENETVDNNATTTRITKYINEFSKKLNRGEISGGIIAIATNDEYAALEWKDWLNKACEDCNLRNPDFELEYTSDDTFIVFW